PPGGDRARHPGVAERSAHQPRAGILMLPLVSSCLLAVLVMFPPLTAALQVGFVSRGSAPDPVREVLSRLIDRALVLAEVDRYAPPEPSVEAVDAAVLAVRLRFSTPEAFAAALARVGMGDRYLRETLREDLRIRAYLDQRFTVVAPTDDDLGRYYRDHPD